jgi:hypothetical protein
MKKDRTIRCRESSRVIPAGSKGWLFAAAKPPWRNQPGPLHL